MSCVSSAECAAVCCCVGLSSRVVGRTRFGFVHSAAVAAAAAVCATHSSSVYDNDEGREATGGGGGDSKGKHTLLPIELSITFLSTQRSDNRTNSRTTYSVLLFLAAIEPSDSPFHCSSISFTLRFDLLMRIADSTCCSLSSLDRQRKHRAHYNSLIIVAFSGVCV